MDTHSGQERLVQTEKNRKKTYTNLILENCWCWG